MTWFSILLFRKSKKLLLIRLRAGTFFSFILCSQYTLHKFNTQYTLTHIQLLFCSPLLVLFRPIESIKFYVIIIVIVVVGKIRFFLLSLNFCLRMWFFPLLIDNCLCWQFLLLLLLSMNILDLEIKNHTFLCAFVSCRLWSIEMDFLSK